MVGTWDGLSVQQYVLYIISMKIVLTVDIEPIVLTMWEIKCFLWVNVDVSV